MSGLKFDSYKMDGAILAVYANERLYVGSRHKLIDVERDEILCEHTKSIRCITADSKIIACCSYDGTATIMDRTTHKLIERIEGPETEMKGIAIENDLIAITTRGRTVWILENLEISKILDDHLQDVKGCCFHEGRLYSWSYDNTVKMYELFHFDHSWELAQSIDLGSIVWNVLFIDKSMYAMLHDGKVVRLVMENSQWRVDREILLSASPIMASCLVDNTTLAVVCNRDCLVILTLNFDILSETLLSGGCDEREDILCCCYWETKGAVVCGGEYSTLYTVYVKRLCT